MIENVCPERRFCFIHIPKTGGTSIERAFGWYQGNRGDQDHQTLILKQENGSIEDDYFVFTYVRNPWSRMVSWYRNVMRDEKKRKRMKMWPRQSFPSFVAKTIKRNQLPPQWDWVKTRNDELGVDFVGRFEHLQRDFETICGKLEIDTITLPHEVASTPVDYRSFYEDKTRRLIEDYYRKDIENWGYEF
ncbi:MAG: sulfotransferase family 2 domain-containing protein [Verrucomicrobiota bacterium JB023]|nr:sulfotransferase family 2 domain-containing protein [Verrucomicrobiota bacterium JB023]